MFSSIPRPSGQTPRVSVILSTYNSPSLLENSLSGLLAQDWPEFEVIIADDGSTRETGELVERISGLAPFPVSHVWHPDEGFRKPAILNQAIVSAKNDYLIFTDGDCIPRRDFVRVHAKNAAVGRFLSAGVEYLSASATRELNRGEILDQSVFDPAWIRSRRERPRFFGKINHSPLAHLFAKWSSFTLPTFNGHNSSAWKSDLLEVNGFDERMKYGGLDRELGERLVNRGIRGRSVRHDAICLHQYHGRPYAIAAEIEENRQRRAKVRRERISRTPFGIVKEA